MELVVARSSDNESKLPSLSHEDPRTIRAGIGSERWRDLHEHSRILIIENNHSTAQRLLALLTPLYGTVELADSSHVAREKISAAIENNVPYSAVVLDLHLGSDIGTNLISSIKGFDAAVVVHTASLTSPITTRLSSNLDGYESAHRLAIAADKAEKNNGVPLLIHHKWDSEKTLVDKIDVAMLIHLAAPGVMHSFLSSWTAPLIEFKPSTEIVHDFSEEVLALYKGVNHALIQLIGHQSFAESTWWSNNSANVLSQHASLRRATFSGLWSGSDNESSQQLHGIVNAIEHLVPPSHEELKMQEDSEIGKILKDWQETFYNAKSHLTSLYQRMRNEVQTSVDLADFIKDNAPGELAAVNGLRHIPNPEDLVVMDPDRQLRNMLRQVLLAVASRQVSSNGTGLFTILVEDNSDQEDARAGRICSKLGSDSFLELSYSDAIARDLNQEFSRVHPFLPDLIRTKKVLVDEMVSAEGLQFTLAIALRSQEIDSTPKDLGTLAPIPAPSFLIPDANKSPENVIKLRDRSFFKYEVDCGGESLVVLEDTHLSSKKEQRPLLMFPGGDKLYLICAEQSSHLAAAIAGAQYYFLSEKPHYPRDLAQMQLGEISHRLYNSGIRILSKNGNFYLNAEAGTQDAKDASEILNNAGISSNNIFCDISKFDKLI